MIFDFKLIFFFCQWQSNTEISVLSRECASTFLESHAVTRMSILFLVLQRDIGRAGNLLMRFSQCSTTCFIWISVSITTKYCASCWKFCRPEQEQVHALVLVLACHLRTIVDLEIYIYDSLSHKNILWCFCKRQTSLSRKKCIKFIWNDEYDSVKFRDLAMRSQHWSRLEDLENIIGEIIYCTNHSANIYASLFYILERNISHV